MVGPSPCCDRQTQEKQTATRDCPRCCKKKKTSHMENIPSTQCATMLNNLALRRQHNNLRVTDAKDLMNTHRTHCRSRMRTHTPATRHAKPNLKTTCGHITKHATHGTHLRTKTTLTSRHLHVDFRNSTTELFDQRWLVHDICATVKKITCSSTSQSN